MHELKQKGRGVQKSYIYICYERTAKTINDIYYVKTKKFGTSGVSIINSTVAFSPAVENE